MLEIDPPTPRGSQRVWRDGRLLGCLAKYDEIFVWENNYMRREWFKTQEIALAWIEKNE